MLRRLTTVMAADVVGFSEKVGISPCRSCDLTDSIRANSFIGKVTRLTSQRSACRMSRTPWLFVIGGAIVLNFSVAYFRFSDPFSSRSLTWMATVLVLVTYVYDMRPKLVQQRMAGL